MRISQTRLMQSLEKMWGIGATVNGGVERLALTDADRDARDLLSTWFEEFGLAVRVDDFGNMVGRRDGREDLPPILIGSHLDTVPNGGRYDGVLGVLSGLEVVRTLNDHGVETKHPIEIVNWTAEEGSRFRPPLFGSGAALGFRNTDVALNAVDDSGIRFGDELARIGYAGETANRPTSASAYLELHIEQGPILEAEDLPVGLVQGIIGQSWHEVTIIGKPGHAGANPMHLRKDALVAAAKMVLEIRKLALEGTDYAVATVGKMTVEPGAMNIVPAKVVFTVDARCAAVGDLEHIHQGLEAIARQVETDEGVSVSISGTGAAESVPFDLGIMTVIGEAIATENLPRRELWSGAGHDAHPASLLWPTGMIFVRSKDGLSHAEAEYSSPDDIEAGTNVLLRTVLSLDAKNQTAPERKPGESRSGAVGHQQGGC